jgi:hypothetical protein
MSPPELSKEHKRTSGEPSGCEAYRHLDRQAESSAAKGGLNNHFYTAVEQQGFDTENSLMPQDCCRIDAGSSE